eukprot:tig00020509_g9757.t1
MSARGHRATPYPRRFGGERDPLRARSGHGLHEYDAARGSIRVPLPVARGKSWVETEVVEAPAGGDPRTDPAALARFVSLGHLAALTCWCMRNASSAELPAGAAGADERDPCAVCLEPHARPVRLACNHVFCLHCLASLPPADFRCPLCRAAPGAGITFLAGEHAARWRADPQGYGRRLDEGAAALPAWAPQAFRDRYRSAAWLVPPELHSGPRPRPAPAAAHDQ